MMNEIDKLFVELGFSPFDGHRCPGHCETYSLPTPKALTLNISSGREEKIAQQLFEME